MSDSKIRWTRVKAVNRIGYILERFSHNGPPRLINIDGETYIGTTPIWVPVTMQDDEGKDTDTTLFVGTGTLADIPITKTEPDDIFEVTLESIEDI